ncbi:hypothetical protein [Polyangium sp. 15x6]|uniref:hypothetical protein n=1 Tax=Polyangium sp. 15x6 TaxID=3042687 RepID=UPI00249CBC0A|nr:hypothetical protein [Polyangium sp. 15x6]MDI3282733.1 hypothetical protein [Polyangium sp. 15x6]
MRRALAFTAIVVSSAASARVAEAQVRVATLEKPAIALDLYGWVMPRLVITPPGDYTGERTDAQFSVPQSRLGAVATLGRWAEMHTEVELAGFFTSVSVPFVLDAYVTFTPHRSRSFGVDVTLGRFRVPISRQNLLQPLGLQTPLPIGRPSLLPDRHTGGMLGLDILDRKIRLLAGVYNGWWGSFQRPGVPITVPDDIDAPWLLYAGRLELQPFGPAPSFEGDARPVARRRKPALAIGASVLRTGASYEVFLPGPLGDHEVGEFGTTAWGADLGFWFAGASFYGEFLYIVQNATSEPTTAPVLLFNRRSFTANAQLGYFLPFGPLREHLEIVARAQLLNDGDGGVEELYADAGANVFFDRGHRLKMQLFYGSGPQFDIHRVTLQATAGF